jgi:glutamate synthase domain-containing protein 2
MDTADEADSYDAMDNRAPNEAFVGRLVELNARGRMLDIGTGPGHIPLLVCARIPAANVVGIDLAENMLRHARRHLDASGADDVTLIITGGLRTPADFAKALALGADAVALSNSAIQAIGCLGMRACHTNNCPVGIATQKPHLRERLAVEQAARRLANFFSASAELMKVLARACGHTHLGEFELSDLVTWKREMAELSGVSYAGVAGIGSAAR